MIWVFGKCFIQTWIRDSPNACYCVLYLYKETRLGVGPTDQLELGTHERKWNNTSQRCDDCNCSPLVAVKFFKQRTTSMSTRGAFSAEALQDRHCSNFPFGLGAMFSLFPLPPQRSLHQCNAYRSRF